MHVCLCVSEKEREMRREDRVREGLGEPLWDKCKKS